MLILVAVTINIVINGGLIGYAQNAKADWETELAKELEEIQKAEYEMAKLTGESGINLAQAYKEGQTVSLSEKKNYPQKGDLVKLNLTDYTEEMYNLETTNFNNKDVTIKKLSTQNDYSITIPTEDSGVESKTYYKFERNEQLYIILDIDEQTGELILLGADAQAMAGLNRLQYSLQNTAFNNENIQVQKLLRSGYRINRAADDATTAPMLNISLKGATGFLNATNIIDQICNLRFTNKFITKARSLKIEDIEGQLGEPTINTNTIDTTKQQYYPSREGIDNIKQGSNMPYAQTYKEYDMSSYEGNDFLKKHLTDWQFTFNSNTLSCKLSYILGNTSVKYEDDGTVGFYIASVEDGKLTGKKLFSSDGTASEISDIKVRPVSYLNSSARGIKSELYGINCWVVGKTQSLANTMTQNIEDDLLVIERLTQSCNKIKDKITQNKIKQEDIDEINYIANNTIFNGVQLANGSRSDVIFQYGSNSSEKYTIVLPNLTAEGLGITQDSSKYVLESKAEDIQNKITELNKYKDKLIKRGKENLLDEQENSEPENLAITSKLIRASNSVKKQIEQMIQNGVTQDDIDEINTIANRIEYNGACLANGEREQVNLTYGDTTVNIQLQNLTTEGIGITLNSTQQELTAVVENIQRKIDEISKIQADLEKYYKENPEENTSNSESTIRDTEMMM